MRKKRSAVALCTARADAGAVTSAGGESHRETSNIDNIKSISSCDTAEMQKVHARMGEYLPILDALVTCSGVENIPHVREEYYSRKAKGLSVDERETFDTEFHSKTRRMLEMLYHDKKSNASGDVDVFSCHVSDPHVAETEICTAVEGVEDAFLEIIPSILTAAEDLLEAIAVFNLAECDSQPYLLNGAAIQELFKNIPRGDAFGDVRKNCFGCAI